MAGTLAFHGSLGIWALAWATVLGMAIHAGWMVASMRPCGYGFRLRWHGWTEPAREVARQYWPALLSAMVASGGLLVDQAMAAMLPRRQRFRAGVCGPVRQRGCQPAGRRHFLGYWRRACRSSPRCAIGKAAAPRCAIGADARLALDGGRGGADSGFAAAGARGSEHGAFRDADSNIVSWVLAMYALQIPFFVVSRVPYRLIVAIRRTDLVFYCGGINLVLDVGFNLILMRSMGVAGIALATSLWCVSTCAFLWFWALQLLKNAERGAEERSRT